MPDTASRAILAWMESSRLHDEREQRLEGHCRQLARVLAELRQHPELTALVDELMAKHGMVVQWGPLQAIYGATAPD